jgi:hypothetical protein
VQQTHNQIEIDRSTFTGRRKRFVRRKSLKSLFRLNFSSCWRSPCHSHRLIYVTRWTNPGIINYLWKYHTWRRTSVSFLIAMLMRIFMLMQKSIESIYLVNVNHKTDCRPLFSNVWEKEIQISCADKEIFLSVSSLMEMEIISWMKIQGNDYYFVSKRPDISGNSIVLQMIRAMKMKKF